MYYNYDCLLLTEAQVNQWISKSNWKDQGDGYVYISNQEDNIKTKNITEKITFEGYNHYAIILKMFSYCVFIWKAMV